MKKILLLILTLFLFFACYIIFQLTEKQTLNYVLIGDERVNNPFILQNEIHKNNFVNNDYRVIDLLKIIKYNEEILIDDKLVSIHQQLKDADVVVISIGMEEINNKLNNNTKDKYSYVNKFIDNLEELFLLINKYDYKRVFFINYFNTDDNNKELFNYLNIRINKIANEMGIYIIDLNYFIKLSGVQGENVKKNDLNIKTYEKMYNFIVENLEKC